MFEPAELDDAEALVALRDGIARWLANRGIDQWSPGEFPRKRMRSWIERGHVHVHRRAGAIVAAVAVLDDDPEIWSDDRDDAGYIHLLMVDRAHAGSGLGDVAVTYAEQQIRDRGGTVARLDAVASNGALHAWYVDRGIGRSAAGRSGRSTCSTRCCSRSHSRDRFGPLNWLGLAPAVGRRQAGPPRAAITGRC